MSACVHTKSLEGLGYLEWHAKAEQLTKDGWEQRLCEGCGKWMSWWKDGEMLP